MSLVDDRAAEIDAQLSRAWQKCRYGKKYSPAYEVARQIKTLRKFLSSKNHSAVNRLILLWRKLDAAWLGIMGRTPDLDVKEWCDLHIALSTAWVLLVVTVSSNKKFRKIADALDAQPSGEDPRLANILKAYDDCIDGTYPPTIVEKGDGFVRCHLPTLAQLRDRFEKRFGQKCWPGDFSVRKTLRLLGLELSEAKRGPKVGSRSLIRNRKR